MGSGGRGRAVRVALIALALIAVLLVVAQLVLPGIAADRVSSKLGRYGHVQSVSVSAWPAIELLWGDADSVHVHATSLELSPEQVAKLLSEAGGASSIDARVDAVRLNNVHARDAVLRKRGSALQAEATMTQADVAASLPGVQVGLLGGEAGSVRVRVGARLFGLSGGVDAVASASSGRLVVAPEGIPFLPVRLTLFSDAHVSILAVRAQKLDQTPPAYRLGLTGRLR
jgi:hypothetical protein